MRRFHKRQFREARDLYRASLEGPKKDIAQRAQLHITMCERRLQEAVTVTPHTAEEHYTYAVAMLNTRNAAPAREHLQKALAQSPDSDHIHYAMALAAALLGDFDTAYVHMHKAIELEPRNRMAARQDTDFAPFASQPPLDLLLFPEKRGW